MRLAFLLLILAPITASAQGTGTLKGQVLEPDSVTAITGANVRVGSTTLGAATDTDGNYRIIGVPVGTYTVTASYSGSQSVSIEGVEVTPGSTRVLSFALLPGSSLDCISLCYGPPLLVRGPYMARVFPGNRFSNGFEDSDTCGGCGSDAGDYWGEQ